MDGSGALAGGKGRGLWAHRDFLRLWCGQSVSEVGSEVTILALPLTAILVLHATEWELGLLRVAWSGPRLIFSVAAGICADTMRRRPLLIGADLCRAVTLAAIPTVAVLGGLKMWMIFLVAFIVGTFDTLFVIAYQSFLPSVVSRANLLEGNSKLQTTSAVAQVAGPGIGGGLLQLCAAPFVLLLDSLSFLLSAAMLAMVRTDETKPGADGAAAGTERTASTRHESAPHGHGAAPRTGRTRYGIGRGPRHWASLWGRRGLRYLASVRYWASVRGWRLDGRRWRRSRQRAWLPTRRWQSPAGALCLDGPPRTTLAAAAVGGGAVGVGGVGGPVLRGAASGGAGGAALAVPVSAGGAALAVPVSAGGAALAVPVSAGGAALAVPVSAGGAALAVPVSAGRSSAVVPSAGGAPVLAAPAGCLVLDAPAGGQRPAGDPESDEPKRGRRRAFLAELGVGWQQLYANPLLRAICGSSAILGFFFGIQQTVLIAYLSRGLRLDSFAIGAVLAVGSVGSVLGAMLAGSTAHRHLGSTLILAVAVNACGAALLGFASGTAAIPILIVAQLLIGVSFPLYFVNQTSLRQAVAPPECLGRITAAFSVVSWGMIPLGALVGGALPAWVGIQATLAVGGIGKLGAVGWLLCSPVRHVRRIPAAA